MSLRDALARQEAAWQERPLVRSLYDGWFRLVASRLSGVAGESVELGSGIGKFQHVAPTVIATDVERTAWVDRVVHAEALPYEDGSLANLVLIDVFHHLRSPSRFLDEAARALARGGRVVILDPFCSPLSTVAYRAFHHERVDLRAPAFGDDEDARGTLDANQARATLVFFRCADEYARRWPQLPIVERRRLAVLAYPLSGGFTGRRLVPSAFARPLVALDRLLEPVLAPLTAFRCLVVLERR